MTLRRQCRRSADAVESDHRSGSTGSIHRGLAIERFRERSGSVSRHGVSRKTGYKWLERFKAGGTPALWDRPRRWRAHPHTTSADVVELVVGTRKRHPTWGPPKLKAWIAARGYDCPSPSTIGAIPAREGACRVGIRRPVPGAWLASGSEDRQRHAVLRSFWHQRAVGLVDQAGYKTRADSTRETDAERPS